MKTDEQNRIDEIAEHEYTMELQNLSDRLVANEAFMEGIKVGAKAGLQ